MEKYIKRLFEEWCKHSKIIIAVDFDDTIFPFRAGFNSLDQDRTIALLKEAQQVGCYITIFTASDISRYPLIKEYCTGLGIEVASINCNAIKDLKYGKQGKIYYNINLCDRSGLTQALDILEGAMVRYSRYLIWTKGKL